jgi:hypothetical protein
MDRVFSRDTDIHAAVVSAPTPDLLGLALVSSWFVSAQERSYCSPNSNESQNQESQDDSDL